MRVLHVLPSLSPAWGGPVSVVSNLLPVLEQRGVRTAIFSTVGRTTGQPAESLQHEHTRVFETDAWEYAWIAHAPRLRAALDAAAADYDLIHIHELWHYPHWAAYRAAVGAGVPFVVTAHGQLDPWALEQKRLAKRIYARLLLHPSLAHAAALHALSPREREQMRHFGTRAPITIVPNGVPVRALQSTAGSERLYARFPDLRGRRVVLFLGRLDPQKGPDLLLQAFVNVSRRFDSAHLLIVGPGRSRFATGLRGSARALGLSTRVTFAGPLFGDDRDAAIRAAEAVVAPSRSEGQSVAVLEVLAAARPMVLTRASNVPDIVSEGGALLSDDQPSALATEIERVLRDPVRAAAMGRTAQSIVREHYTWDELAGHMEALYASALHAPSS